MRARSALNKIHFAGLAIGGSKSDKTSLASIEYYPEQNKIFLHEIVDKIKNEGELSADTQIVELMSRSEFKFNTVALNAPLTAPPCVTCKLKCPGVESCKVSSVSWMWDHYHRQVLQKKNHKLFSPYTERWVDHFLSTDLEEPIPFIQALGANTAPLWARTQFLIKRIQSPKIEVNTKLSLWRIGNSLHVAKSHLRFHKHQIDGDFSRRALIHELVARNLAFFYEQDIRILVENVQAFDAFLCALTAVLKFKGQCEGRPKTTPQKAGWIEIPKVDIIW